jgi:biopolymer transport protein ExbD
MKRRETLTPDMTPLIDVVFILLIFFIVTSVFKKEELALLLNLPDSHAQTLEVEKENITIELSTEKLAYKGRELTLEKVEEELKQITDKKRAVIVRIDENVPYKRIIEVLDILQENELNNLSLATRKNR